MGSLLSWMPGRALEFICFYASPLKHRLHTDWARDWNTMLRCGFHAMALAPHTCPPHPCLLLILYRPNGVRCPAESNHDESARGTVSRMSVPQVSRKCPAESNHDESARGTMSRMSVPQVSRKCPAESNHDESARGTVSRMSVPQVSRGVQSR